MNVLGYSGLDGSREFRLRELGTLTEQDARIFQGMDSAAALLCDGAVVAAVQEERLTKEKHAHRFPRASIEFCLKQAGIGIASVDCVAHGFDFRPARNLYQRSALSRRRFEEVYSPERQKVLLAENFPELRVDAVFRPVSHHHAHAASAFYQSAFQDALVVVMDGLGEMHSISVFSASCSGMRVLKQYGLFSSLGLFYSLVTTHLGFLPNSDEYKVMGLAPYGDPRQFLPGLDLAVECKQDGLISLPLLALNKTPESRETYGESRRWLAETFFPPREPNSPITDTHRDFAAAAQQTLNKAVAHLLRHWQLATGHTALCLAGGVALNCVSNGEVLRSGIFEKMYIQPAAGDEGTSLGAALYRHFEANPTERSRPPELPLYGHDVREAEVSSAIVGYAGRVRARCYEKVDGLLEEAVQRIAAGEVVGWMQGRMEFGPRALGNRSILADPRDPRMVERLNSMVKRREPFRPFAPAVMKEKAHLYFDVPAGAEFPYMLFTVPTRTDAAGIVPAVVHVDGSSRIQTVDHHQHPLFWRLLKVFERRTGVPMLLNTSFNVRGQPIVCTPEDAIETFLNTDISALFLGRHLILKSTGYSRDSRPTRQPTAPEN